MAEWECRLTLRHDDFIMQNHRVHGVSLMPGVTLFDIVVRALACRGEEPSRLALDNVMFPRPIATRPGLDSEIRVRIESSGPARHVSIASRGVVDDKPLTDWAENCTADLIDADDASAPIGGAPALGPRTSSMDALYAQARAELIVHGPPMRCAGRVRADADEVVAELDLDPSSGSADTRFAMHPAKLDAATVVAFSRRATPGEAYIPMFVARFRYHRPLHGPFVVHVPSAATVAASGDVVHADCLLYDADGNLAVEMRRMTCKRIRHAQLITRLVDAVAS